ncbi:YaaR family protein [Breznakiellaceae bacterium SP9]
MPKIPEAAFSYVNPLSYTIANPESKKSKQKTSPLKEGRESRFTALLERINHEDGAAQVELLGIEAACAEDIIQALMDEVHSAGDDLKNRPLKTEILRYKKAVKNFLRYVVENCYVLEQDIGIRAYLKPGFKKPISSPDAMKQNGFKVIAIVDHKLDQLAAGILAGQSTQLEILARLEEITGILVDLLQ